VGSVLALMLSLLEIGRAHGPAGTRAVLGLTCALALILLFLAVERRVAHPIVPLALFRNRTFSTTNVCLFLSGLAMFGAISFIPLFVQAVLGGTAIQAGSVLTPTSLCWVAGSTIGGRLINRLGYRTLAVAGMVCLTTGYFFFSRLGPWSSLRHAAASGMILGLGMGMSTVTTVVATQSAAPKGQIGVVSSLPFFFRNIGATIGVAIMGTILNASMTRAGGGPLHLGAGEGVLQTLSDALRGQLADGIRAAFLFGLAAVACGILASLFVPNLSPTRPGLSHVAQTTPGVEGG
jgi:predicted MFS family arabinose efflux permease